LRDRARSVATGLEKRRDTSALVDAGYLLFERDRDTDGGVVASAVALRVFLFFIPIVLVVVATLGFVADRLSPTQTAREVGVTGSLARQIDIALHQSTRARWLALISGFWGIAIAGRSLARVLIAASRRAWSLPARTTSARRLRVIGALAGLVSAAGALTIIANRARSAAGVVGGSATIVTAAVVYSLAWFVVSLVLPRGTRDRSAALPGALFVGVGLAVGQSVLQFTVPGQISRASELYGAIGLVVVSLSWFFLVGRIFVVSFAIDAVVWERFGSVNTWLMQWRLVQRLVTRYPRVRRMLGAAPDRE
jgi:uncharacterized BrkB/YihY/UPF0761 family membrane protein